jgi:hypothetical protein
MMTIQMRKFGTILNSRPAGREALLAIMPTLPIPAPRADQPALGLPGGAAPEDIELDFEGVEVLTPSFAEEFVVSLRERYPGRVRVRNTHNVTVKTTLEFLAQLGSGQNF